MAVLLASVAVSVRASEIIDRVMAIVAGNLITLSDVNAAKELGLLGPGAAGASVGEILPRLIDRALMLGEVDRYAPPEPAAAAVDRQVDALRARFAGPQAFETALARVGYDERHLRETFRQDLRLLAYLDQRFTVPPPTEDDLGRYYTAHPEEFTISGQLAPLDVARPRITEIVTVDRRSQLVSDWVAGLRRRAEIVEVSEPAR